MLDPNQLRKDLPSVVKALAVVEFPSTQSASVSLKHAVNRVQVETEALQATAQCGIEANWSIKVQG